MRIGDIDGKGKIYDDEGHLILEEGEILHSQISKTLITIGRGWSPFGKILFDGSYGNGTIFLTDKRIVFIRRPDVKSIKTSHWLQPDFGSGEVEEKDKAIAHANRLNAFQAFDYLEIRYEDIALIKRGPINRRICINWMDKHTSFIISTREKRVMIPIILKEMRKFKGRAYPNKARKIAVPKSKVE